MPTMASADMSLCGGNSALQKSPSRKFELVAKKFISIKSSEERMDSSSSGDSGRRKRKSGWDSAPSGGSSSDGGNGAQVPTMGVEGLTIFRFEIICMLFLLLHHLMSPNPN
jgi:hypothetical protein